VGPRLLRTRALSAGVIALLLFQATSGQLVVRAVEPTATDADPQTWFQVNNKSADRVRIPGPSLAANFASSNRGRPEVLGTAPSIADVPLRVSHLQPAHLSPWIAGQVCDELG
jgi:hypothetical protein